MDIFEKRTLVGARSTTLPAYMTTISSVTRGHDAKVVGHQDHAHVPITLQGAQQSQDLGLHGDVESGGGLVGHQQPRADARAMAMITRWRMPPESWCG